MEELELAFRLLREFKAGKFTEGHELSAEELHLVGVLAADLLATEVDGTDNFHDLIYALAAEDSKWNRALGEALDKFYREIEAGKKNEGISALKSFLGSCPSRWYRGIAEIELENLKST